MARHLLKSGFGQCECKWCGHRRQFYGNDCPVTIKMRKALAAYAKANGRAWKSKLWAEWTNGKDLGQELQLVRNVMGPSLMQKVTPLMLKMAENHKED